MSKSKSRNHSNKRRDIPRIANATALPFEMPSPRLSPMAYLSEIEDRRRYDPSGGTSPARSVSRPQHTLVLPQPKNPDRLGNRVRNSQLPSGVAFQSPEKVLVCIRRKMRKEVLHALKKAGKTGQKRPRRSYYSDIHC